MEGLRTNAPLHRVLIVDPDSASFQALHGKLSQAGFSVTLHQRSEDALAAIEREQPHLVMLDWDLPGVIAVQVVRHVRGCSSHRETRVIALSTLGDEQHVVSGFEFGIDDYVVKPFSTAEVVARVRAMLRSLHSAAHEMDFLEFGMIRMDASEGRVTVQDRSIGLRSMEFRLLEFLMRHPERACRREQLLERVWGHDCTADPRAVDVTVQRIRRALAPHDCDGYLQTIRGVGYRLSITNSAR